MDNGLVQALLVNAKEEHPVLILVVVDNGLVPKKVYRQRHAEAVLILVVVDNGLVLYNDPLFWIK